MNKAEFPELNAELSEARIQWAASFLEDWLIHQIELNRINDPSDIIQLREEFPPIPVENDKGIDFTINDVLTAALRRREYLERQFPHIPIDKHPSGKAHRKAIKLLTKLVDDPPKPEQWTQISFLDD